MIDPRKIFCPFYASLAYRPIIQCLAADGNHSQPPRDFMRPSALLDHILPGITALTVTFIHRIAILQLLEPLIPEIIPVMKRIEHTRTSKEICPVKNNSKGPVWLPPLGIYPLLGLFKLAMR